MIEQTINNKILNHHCFTISSFCPFCFSLVFWFCFLFASNSSDMIPLTYSGKIFTVFIQMYMKKMYFFLNLLSFVFSVRKDCDCIYENACSWMHNVFSTGLGNVLPKEDVGLQRALDAWGRAAKLGERISCARMGNSNPEKRFSQIRNYSGNRAILQESFTNGWNTRGIR